MRTIFHTTLLIVFLGVAFPVHAQLTSPQIGWQAELTKLRSQCFRHGHDSR